MKAKPKTAFYVWLVLFAWGFIALVRWFVAGHVPTNYGSYVPWGLWVAAYVYLAGLSAGCFLISALVYAFGVKWLKPIGRLSLFTALVAIVMALVCIFFDLGHSFRAWEVITRPNFHSVMAWMIWLYTAYMALLAWQFYLSVKHDLPARTVAGHSAGATGNVTHGGAEFDQDARRIRLLSFIGIPLAVAFCGGVGALFGTVVGLPLWHSPLYPILFLIGGLLSGSALLTAVVALGWGREDMGWNDLVHLLGRATLILIAIYFLLEWAEFSVPMWYAIGPEYTQLTGVLFGPFWYVFWIFHLVLGMIVPAYLLLRRPDKPVAVAAAAILAVINFFAVRLNLVIPAQVTPRLRGLEWSYRDMRLSFEYLPSLFEWQLLVFVLAVGAALLYAGFRLLPLTGSGAEKGVQL